MSVNLHNKWQNSIMKRCDVFTDIFKKKRKIFFTTSCRQTFLYLLSFKSFKFAHHLRWIQDVPQTHKSWMDKSLIFCCPLTALNFSLWKTCFEIRCFVQKIGNGRRKLTLWCYFYKLRVFWSNENYFKKGRSIFGLIIYSSFRVMIVMSMYLGKVNLNEIFHLLLSVDLVWGRMLHFHLVFNKF